jgi:Phospholipase_D-nuclease N-terminal/Short C-terminal domain
MMLASDFPLLNVFWTMLWFFLSIVWIMAVFHVLGDIFRSIDMGGVAKAVWLMFVVLLPFLGVFVYLVARGDKMTQHDIDRAQRQSDATQTHISPASRTAGAAALGDQLSQLASLRDSGAITPDEYDAGKAKVLA